MTRRVLLLMIGIIQRHIWTVQWYNIKTGRSKDKGVVIMQDSNFKVCPVWFLMICVINCYDHVLVTHQQDHHQRNNYSQSQHYRRRKLDVKERLQFKEFSQKVMMETWRETGQSPLLQFIRDFTILTKPPSSPCLKNDLYLIYTGQARDKILREEFHEKI